MVGGGGNCPAGGLIAGPGGREPAVGTEGRKVKSQGNIICGLFIRVAHKN